MNCERKGRLAARTVGGCIVVLALLNIVVDQWAQAPPAVVEKTHTLEVHSTPHYTPAVLDTSVALVLDFIGGKWRARPMGFTHEVAAAELAGYDALYVGDTADPRHNLFAGKWPAEFLVAWNKHEVQIWDYLTAKRHSNRSYVGVIKYVDVLNGIVRVHFEDAVRVWDEAGYYSP